MTEHEGWLAINFLIDRGWTIDHIGAHYDEHSQPVSFYITAYDQTTGEQKTWYLYERFQEYFHVT